MTKGRMCCKFDHGKTSVSQILAKFGGGRPIKCHGGGENWSKLCSLGGQVSTLTLIFEA